MEIFVSAYAFQASSRHAAGLESITDALLVFKARGKTRGSLEIDGGNDVFWFDGLGSGNLYEFGALDVFNPKRFRYTAVDGTVYLPDEDDGLVSLTDPNGNTLSVTRGVEKFSPYVSGYGRVD